MSYFLLQPRTIITLQPPISSQSPFCFQSSLHIISHHRQFHNIQSLCSSTSRSFIMQSNRISKNSPSKVTNRVGCLAAHLIDDRNESPDPITFSPVTLTNAFPCSKRAANKTSPAVAPDSETSDIDSANSSSDISEEPEEPPRFNARERVSTRTSYFVIGHPNAYRYKRARTPFDIEAVMEERKEDEKAAETRAKDSGILPSTEDADGNTDASIYLSNTCATEKRASSLSTRAVKSIARKIPKDNKSAIWEVNRAFMRALEAQRDEATKMAAVIAEGEDLLWG
ncbi:hypothetical protein LY76DRAFT_688043 [Colletotrichum caudatum]|nr:hypothetical protein LY76DRAFT_688043 [Colletotrichum caudatum]